MPFEPKRTITKLLPIKKLDFNKQITSLLLSATVTYTCIAVETQQSLEKFPLKVAYKILRKIRKTRKESSSVTSQIPNRTQYTTPSKQLAPYLMRLKQNEQFPVLSGFPIINNNKQTKKNRKRKTPWKTNNSICKQEL